MLKLQRDHVRAPAQYCVIQQEMVAFSLKIAAGALKKYVF